MSRIGFRTVGQASSSEQLAKRGGRQSPPGPPGAPRAHVAPPAFERRGSPGLGALGALGTLLAVLAVHLAVNSAAAQYGQPYGYDPGGALYGLPYGYDMSGYMYGMPFGYGAFGSIYGWPYGYGTSGPSYGTPFGYDGSGSMYGTPYGYGSVPLGQGDPLQQQLEMLQQQMNAHQQQLNAEMARVQQEMAQFDQAAKARMAEINRYFIQLYRTTTADTASSDEVALLYGQQIHCQRNPVDCQLAAQQAQESAAALAANNAAFQARMSEQQAAFDARNAQWQADQDARAAANTDWINTVILGLDDYSSGAGGPTYQLPFAPSAGQTYRSPLGNPLVFDASQNVWYQIGPDGSRTPFYNVP